MALKADDGDQPKRATKKAASGGHEAQRFPI